LEIYNIEKISRKTPKRNYIRVQPKEDIIVHLQTKEDSFATIMYDISIKGCALIHTKKLPINVDDIIKISFILDNENYFEFNAELKSISKLNHNLYRYHFYFEPSIQEEKKLENFIKKREKEIIKELQEYMKKETI
jgi:hypothetical protein